MVGLRVDFQTEGCKAGEKRTRPVFTLVKHRHALYPLWKQSKQKLAAQKLGLTLKERAWYTHMSLLERYAKLCVNKVNTNVDYKREVSTKVGFGRELYQ